MLQELEFGRLENEFYDKLAASEDLVVCIKNNQVLAKRTKDNQII